MSGNERGIRDFDDIGVTTTMEQNVSQLQQKVFALKAQVADQSGLADAVRAVNNHATVQGEKDTPSLIDLKGVGRPKEFPGTEEGFQQWSKKTEAFFAGAIKESEMMLEWAAEQPTVKNPLEAWRRLQKRYDPTTGGRKRNFLGTIIFLGRCSLLELQAGIERWESYVSSYEKKLKDKLDDEIKLAGLEALFF